MYLYLHSIWAINSVGSECLPYKEEVGGSSPSLPTKETHSMSGFFVLFFFIDTKLVQMMTCMMPNQKYNFFGGHPAIYRMVYYSI